MKLKKKIKIIGEAGINHDGSFKKAMKLINHGSKAGVDFVKFQLFDTREFINKNYIHNKVNYHKVFKRFKSLEFSLAQWKKLINFGKRKGVKIFFSIFETKSLLILKKLRINLVKIPSGEVTNIPLLTETNKLRLNVILSTGMCSFKEIHSALKVLKNSKITIMHCVSEYPATRPSLNNILLLKEKFKKKVGYSDHTSDILTPALSVMAGAEIIEKHFTLSKKNIGDHKFSLLPNDLKNMVRYIRQSEISFGSKNNRIISSKEKKLKFFARKGLYAKKDIVKNQIIKLKDIAILRPEGPTKVSELKKILNKKTKKNIKKGQAINKFLLR